MAQLTLIPVSHELKAGRDHHYTLTLDRDHLRDLAFENPVAGLASERASNGTEFRLFYSSARSSDSFNPMSNGETYFAYLGHMGIREISDMAILLRQKDQMPIEVPSPIPGEKKPVTIGYVHFVFPEGTLVETLK